MEKQTEYLWNVPKFSFKVIFENKSTFIFQEVEGLESETNEMEQQEGENPSFSIAPHMNNTNTVTLKKGICQSNDDLVQWLAEIKSNRVSLQTITIQLMEEEKTLFSWSLENAYPIKVINAGIDAGIHEIELEEIVLSFQNLILKNE